MYKDTYNVPAYNFALIRSGNYDLTSVNNDVVDFNKMDVFSFDDLDGLTVKEIEILLGLDNLKFVCCYGVDELKFALDHILSCNRNGYNYRHSFFIVKYILDLKGLEVSDKRIDEIIEERLMNAYPSANEEEKRVFNCFFERYQDKTYQDTVNRTYRMRGLRKDI